jgi:DNA-binding CsgD family transcriptional regulator
VDDFGLSVPFSSNDEQSDRNDEVTVISTPHAGVGVPEVCDTPIRRHQSDVRHGKYHNKTNFYNAALRVLYTLTPAILILDSHRHVVFANWEAEELLAQGDVISMDRKGQIYCADKVAQNFLLQYMTTHKTSGKSLFNDEDGSFLIPKTDGWPMVAMVGCDQLDSLTFSDGDFDVERHVTLMIRDPNGRHPEQSEKLMAYFGLSGAETTVVGELIKGSSTSEIARKRGVSVVTIRNQLKSAQSKMGVTRQSELVSLVLRYIS